MGINSQRTIYKKIITKYKIIKEQLDTCQISTYLIDVRRNLLDFLKLYSISRSSFMLNAKDEET